MKHNKLKPKILLTLKQFGKLPTARISAIMGVNYYYIKDELEALYNDGLIVKEKAGDLATYWELKQNGEEIQDNTSQTES